MLELKTSLDRETSFMMLEPDERKEEVEAVMESIRAVEAEPNSVVLVAEVEGDLVGYVEATGGKFRRNRLSAYVVIGVRQSAAGSGIGGSLLAGLDSWAQAHGVRRLELTVMTHNRRAIALYERRGYTTEGVRRQSLLVDRAYVDELAMAKLSISATPMR